MATGINYKIVEGEQTFSQFIWCCARSMGPFMFMREESNDAKLRFPDEAPGGAKSNAEAHVLRAQKRLSESRAEWQAEDVKSPEQVESEYETYKAERMAEYAERLACTTPINERVTRMRSQVADWEVPSKDHIALKEHALEQLDIALQYEAKLPEEPEFSQTAAEWHTDHVGWLKDYTDRNEEELREGVEAAASPDVWRGGVVWIEELIASVPPPPGRFEDR